ncbi:SDR family oxidoreductase [Martelella soudanensis]|uniref:SDR family oxidoreductase n=1 Tax=unclassified Martelella TaxID=2629616 RepID=UPI0015E05628|nr:MULTISPECIES: SDR family oxidoreductase [unclassified Martelella]
MADNKVAIVTGASRGIGFEIARLLVERGWKLGITARGRQKLEEAADRLGTANAIAIACDVADPTEVEDAVSMVAGRFGPVTALVNNAGIIDPIGHIHELDPDAFMQLMHINIGGVMNMSRAVLPAMIAARSGVIVNLSSGAAHNPVEGWSAYCTSKAGLAMFSRCLAAEYGGRGVRVHDFIPGVVSTDMLNGAQQRFDNAIARLDEGAKLPADVPARCIAWLVDEGRVEGVQQSIRDPELRKLVGLEERAQW